MNLRIATILFLLIGLTGFAQSQIKASNNNGQLSFAGEHVGMQFEGVFNKWHATLLLPPAAQPLINATFDLSSAETGDSTYDATLPEGDWFDVENHPEGTFTSTSIELDGSAYKVSGNLSLRGKSMPVDFMLKDKGGNLEAAFKIDRLKYSIGLDSDPDAEWVGQFIEMTLVIKL